MTKKIVYCNMCGKKMDFYDIQENLSLRGEMGYGSVHDGECYCLDLCCECMDKLIDKCKISPLVTEW